MAKDFDAVNAELKGPMLIEASAGTGKTYSLMLLILRLLVENEIPVSSILVVTFTKAATFELKSRLRETLTTMTEKLSQANFDADQFINNELPAIETAVKEDPDSFCQLVQKWHQSGLDLQECVYKRLSNALTSIDDAPIYTIHSFCRKMLGDYVFSSHGGYDFGLGDGQAQKKEAIEMFLRTYIPPLLLSLNKAEVLNLLKNTDWNTFIEKISLLTHSLPLSAQVKFIQGRTEDIVFDLEDDVRDFMALFRDTAPQRFREYKRQNRIHTFDDLLTEMEERVTLGSEASKNFVKEVRSLFQAALIDEFQDTDPLQYSIFEALFIKDKDNPDRPVIFVGDPKQSIYSFRNADLDTYVKARTAVSNTQELKTNYRSTPGIVIAINELFLIGGKTSPSSSGAFLDKSIQFSRVDSSYKNPPLMKKNEDGSFVPLPSFDFWSNVKSGRNDISAEEIREIKKSLLTRDIKEMLSGDVYYKGKPLRPSDICILVRNRTHADNYISALKAAGIKVSLSDGSSVMESEECAEIRSLILGMSDPAERRTLNAVRATRVVGDSLNAILSDTQSAIEIKLLLEQAAEVYERNGITAALSLIFERCKTEDRILNYPTEDDPERILTNYQHLFELLHEASKQIHTLQGLIRWIDEPNLDVDEDSENKFTQRKETDSDVVRVVTIHGSKGLQYPVVYLPESQFGPGAQKTVAFREKISNDPNAGKGLLLSLDEAAPNPLEDKQEGVRLVYVALTRAAARLVVPFFSRMTKSGGMHLGSGGKAYLSAALTGNEKGAGAVKAIDDLRIILDQKSLKDEVRRALKDYVISKSVPCSQAVIDAYEPFNIELDICSAVPTGAPYASAAQDDLEAGSCTKTSAAWRTSSFSGLVKNSETPHSRLISDEEEIELEEIVEETAKEISAEDDPDRDLLAPLQLNRGAAEFGTDFHKVMETIFPPKVKYSPEELINRSMSNITQKIPADTENPQELKEKMDADLKLVLDHILSVPFLKDNKDFCLRELIDRPERRMSEMRFLITVGNTPKPGRIPLTAHLLERTVKTLEPRLSGLSLSDADMKGYLTGSIDFAFEVGGKYWIIDWKTNRLGTKASDYTPQAVSAKMDENLYRLQYILYLVAFKRLLESRTGTSSGYRLIGGAAYFFVRGVRKDKPAQGIEIDRPSETLIECLDDFFKNGYSDQVLEMYAQKRAEESAS